MKLTYAYKELFYDAEDVDDIKRFIKRMIKIYGPLDRVKLTCKDKEIWQENWVEEYYNIDNDLAQITNEDVFFSFKSDSIARKIDIYIHKHK
jgi:hypothetical protein